MKIFRNFRILAAEATPFLAVALLTVGVITPYRPAVAATARAQTIRSKQSASQVSSSLLPQQDPIFAPQISANGRFVAYTSTRSDLVSGDTNGASDVFVFDRSTGTTRRVSVSSTGAQGNGDSLLPSISADGRYVVFDSRATNFVSGVTKPSNMSVYRHDLSTNTTILVSTRPDGSPVSSSPGATTSASGQALSDDGNVVVWVTTDALVSPGATQGSLPPSVYVTNIAAHSTKLLSGGVGGAIADAGAFNPAISADGSTVVFESAATNLVAGDTNGVSDVFAVASLGGQVRRVSVGAGGQANGASSRPSISADGRVIAFESEASNLTSNDHNGKVDVFVSNTATGNVTAASVTGSGQTGSGGGSDQAHVSHDGTVVAFVSSATNLAGNDANGAPDVYFRELDAGTTRRASMASADVGANAQSGAPSLNANGTLILFMSDASNLTGAVANQAQIYLFDATSQMGAVPVGPRPMESATGQQNGALSPQGPAGTAQPAGPVKANPKFTG